LDCEIARIASSNNSFFPELPIEQKIFRS
jgi:hypothetical protein